MQFEQHTITIQVDHGIQRQVTAMVGVGSGLAYCPSGGDTENGYALYHLQSGLRLVGEVETPYEAQRWLERVAPLIDWTQEKAAICALGPSIPRTVVELSEQVEEETTALLKSLLSERHASMLEKEATLSMVTVREALGTAIELQDEHTQSQHAAILNPPLLYAYEREVLRTYAGANIAHDMLTLSALGLTGEAGEVADALKKHLFQGHELDEDHLIEELGDILWYLTLACHALNTTLETVIEHNSAKLRRCYPNGFEAQRSIHREEEKKPR